LPTTPPQFPKRMAVPSIPCDLELTKMGITPAPGA
jgi:hypothetical protein